MRARAIQFAARIDLPVPSDHRGSDERTAVPQARAPRKSRALTAEALDRRRPERGRSSIGKRSKALRCQAPRGNSATLVLVLAMASPMKDLAAQRCYNHAHREAAARCAECRHFFCRECVSEHDDRVLCAACLRKLLRKSPARRRSFTGAVQFLQCALGVLAAWFFFYLISTSILADTCAGTISRNSARSSNARAWASPCWTMNV
jgi:hypothetical protein